MLSDCLVFLVGPRGSGKSTVAKHLADLLIGCAAVDADQSLELRAGMPIRAIFEREGEAGFRQRESEILAELASLPRAVIATGGGAVLRKGNRDLMRASGKVIWLTADVDTLWRRISGDAKSAEQRPNLTVGGREEVAQVVAAREPLYRAVADYVVDTTNRSPAEVAENIYGWLGVL